jgi:hypothetical protein
MWSLAPWPTVGAQFQWGDGRTWQGKGWVMWCSPTHLCPERSRGGRRWWGKAMQGRCDRSGGDSGERALHVDQLRSDGGVLLLPVGWFVNLWETHLAKESNVVRFFLASCTHLSHHWNTAQANAQTSGFQRSYAMFSMPKISSRFLLVLIQFILSSVRAQTNWFYSFYVRKNWLVG